MMFNIHKNFFSTLIFPIPVTRMIFFLILRIKLFIKSNIRDRIEKILDGMSATFMKADIPVLHLS